MSTLMQLLSIALAISQPVNALDHSRAPVNDLKSPVSICSIGKIDFHCDRNQEQFAHVQSHFWSTAPESEELSVLWWNVQNGNTDRRATKKYLISPLTENLRLLANSPHSPDIMVLSEANLEFFIRNSINIDLNYPHQLFAPYSSQLSTSGIVVLSKYPITNSQSYLLYGYPTKVDYEAQSLYKNIWKGVLSFAGDYNRKATHITVAKNAHKFNIALTHLINPWPYIFNQMNGSKLNIFMRMISEPELDEKSPLDYQLEQLLDLIEIWKSEPFILIGDLNLPTHAIPQGYRISNFLNYKLFGDELSSYGYRLISHKLTDIFNEHPDTMPTKLSNIFETKYAFKVDQAFSFQYATTNAHVLPLAGSDHYPIFLKLHSQTTE